MSARITSNWDFSGSGAISGICVHFGFVSVPSFSRLIIWLTRQGAPLFAANEHFMKTSSEANMCACRSKNHPSDTWSILGKPLDCFVFILLQFMAFRRSLCWFSFGFPYVYAKNSKKIGKTKQKHCNLPDASYQNWNFLPLHSNLWNSPN